jgi:hypothetical protein
MESYTYAILVENTPKRYLHQESTYLPCKFKKTKYALIEKQVFKDHSEGINFIYYSNDLNKLIEKMNNYISWYNYVNSVTKNIQGYISKLYNC